MIETTIHVAIAAVSLILTWQGAFTLYLMLYTWARPERLAKTCSPDMYRPPRLRFTALLPARHEQEVIAQTVRRVWEADYPKEFLEVAVICSHDDTETIAEAQRAADEIGHPNVRVLVFDDQPVNKQHGLNVGLRETNHEVITIFDSEDDVHPEIFQIINAVMQREGANIVQAGVQLMDYGSSWFAVHNVLEYFFWFKSRLHFHARTGMVTLGGNTVFMKRDLIESVGGWDEKCLTEDADIGIRLSVKGEQISVTYDAEHATREETPPTLKSFIKQRTRWNQGFLQVLAKKDWRQFPRLSQRVFAWYTLTYPFVQAFVGLLWGVALVMMLVVELPVVLAMISLLPLYILVFQLVANLVGLFEFTKVYDKRLTVRDILVFIVGFMPYQSLLSLGALRAIYREFRGMNNWEKTEHTGAHRQHEAPQPVVQTGGVRQAA